MKKNVDFFQCPAVSVLKSAGEVTTSQLNCTGHGSNKDGLRTEGGNDMLAKSLKSLKSVIVLAVALTFFGGTAMADRWGRDYHHPPKRHHHYSKHHPKYYKGHRHGHHRYVVHRRNIYVAPPHPQYRSRRHEASALHALAPRVVIIGGLPIPVPPPPHEVLDYLTSR